MASKVPLNLYLLKPDVTPLRALTEGAGDDDLGDPFADADDDLEAQLQWQRSFRLDEEDPAETALPDQRGGAPSLLVRASVADLGWRRLVASLLPGTAASAQLASSSQHFGALLFQPIGPHLVVWSFGNAWSLLDMSNVMPRFGLRAGLNALLSAKPPAGQPPKQVGVRNLTSAVRATTVRRASLATVRPSSPRTMERLDPSADAAAMADLTTHHSLFDQVSAGRSLRFAAPAQNLRDLRYAAIQALRLHRRDDYAKSPDYEWIDNAIPVGDEAVVEAVLDALWAGATASPTTIVPDVVWADDDPDTRLAPETVRLHGERGATGRTTLTWQIIQQWLTGQHPTLTGASALRTKLRFYTGPLPAAEAELWAHLVAQVDVDGVSYLISDGEIWQFSSRYLIELDARLTSHTVVSPAHLPPYKAGEAEGDYNKRAAKANGHLVLDKALLRLPNQTAVEAGDLLSAKGELMHVKRRSRSSTMSYVANQALAAVHLLRSDAAARTLLDNVVASSKPKPAALRDMRQHCASFGANISAEVQLVIVGQWRGTPSVGQLPLVARLTFDSWLRQMPCARRLVLVGT